MPQERNINVKEGLLLGSKESEIELVDRMRAFLFKMEMFTVATYGAAGNLSAIEASAAFGVITGGNFIFWSMIEKGRKKLSENEQ